MTPSPTDPIILSGGTFAVDAALTPNRPPFVVDDLATTEVNRTVLFNVLDNDSDRDGDRLRIASFTEPLNGTLTLESDGSARYEPDPGFIGIDGFEYTAADGNGGLASTFVRIEVAREDGELPGIGEGLSLPEAQTVAYLYEGALDRDGEIDLPGLNFWIDAREGILPDQGAPLSERDLAFEFLAAPEFERAFGEALDEDDPGYLDDAALVNTLYENLLDRPADDAGEAFWLDALADPGFDRADLLLEFVESNENAQSLAFVDGLTEVSPGEWAFL